MLWWCEGSGAEKNTEIFLEKKNTRQHVSYYKVNGYIFIFVLVNF